MKSYRIKILLALAVLAVMLILIYLIQHPESASYLGVV